MRCVRVAFFVFFAACSASAAWAQYGLYGSPDMLPVTPQNSAQSPPATAAYPTTAAPMVPPAPVYYRYPAQPPATAYTAQSYPSAATTYQPYPSAAPYRYPAQSPAVAMYQPYQSGAQYQYPGPYYRPPMPAVADARPAPIPMPGPAGTVSPTDSTLLADPLAVPGTGVMNQMLAEQGSYGCGAYGSAMNRFDQAACGTYAGGCGNYGNNSCFGQDSCDWYASFAALVLGRSDGRCLWTSYADGQNTVQLANTQFNLEWQWGGEVTLGRRFCCGCVPYAVEATYWTIAPFSGCQVTTNPGGDGLVSTPLVIAPMMFGATSAENWFDGAQEQRVWRQDECQNVEINVIREQLVCGCNSPWDVGWSAGLRFFRFQDDLTFGSLQVGGTWGGAGSAYLSDNITNDLFGVQCGFDVGYNLCGVRLFLTPKVGIYNNFLESNFQANTGDGVNGTGPYGSFPVHATTNGLAFLTQLDAGAEWQFARNWSVRAGYRFVAVTGMGLADDQFPQYMVDTPSIAAIQHSSSLVLQGAFAGVTYCF